MKSGNYKKVTSLPSYENENLYEISDKELGRIHRKYHPQENDLFDAVDDEYMKWFEMVFGPEEVE